MQVYCDCAATTKPYLEVLNSVVDTMDLYYGNPSSEHTEGTKAGDLLRKSRHSIAENLGAKDSEIYLNLAPVRQITGLSVGLLRPVRRMVKILLSLLSLSTTPF